MPVNSVEIELNRLTITAWEQRTMPGVKVQRQRRTSLSGLYVYPGCMSRR
jgi:hypothetical protein